MCYLIPVVLMATVSTAHSQETITYHEHIAPIIQENCVSCHADGQIGPMPLTNYMEVSSYASMIHYVTSTRYMPPWKPVHPVGAIEGEQRLTDQEIKQIEKWLKTGMKEGTTKNTVFTKKNIQHIADPDAIFVMTDSFEQYGVYYDQYRVFVIPTNLKEDKAVTAIEFVPGNPDIVRSCFISIDTTDRVKAFDEWDPQLGYFSFGALGFDATAPCWYNWHLGKGATFLPEGYWKSLPENAKLLLHIHYGPTDTPQKDASYVKFKFAEKPLDKQLFVTPFINRKNISNPSFEIPAGKVTRVHGKFTVQEDMELHGIYPHCHLLGQQWEIFAVDPEGNSEVLLKIDDWDFKWKQMYDFKNIKTIKKGSVIHALALYDNTLDNLSNPSDPPRTMRWGKRMFEEMFMVYFKWAKD